VFLDADQFRTNHFSFPSGCSSSIFINIKVIKVTVMILGKVVPNVRVKILSRFPLNKQVGVFGLPKVIVIFPYTVDPKSLTVAQVGKIEK
jgi:hypothetical protein